MSKVLVLAFEPSEAVAGAAFAQRIGLAFDVLSLAGPVDLDLGAENVRTANLGDLGPADGLADAIATACAGYTHIVAVSSMRSKDVVARLAGLLDIGMITDAIGASSPKIFMRPVVAGAIIATVEALELPVAITIRPAGFGQPTRSGQSTVESIDLAATSQAKVVDKSQGGGARPDLTQAKIIISGGRPLKDAATFESVLGAFADKVAGAVGATRAAVDSGIAPNELQVGQTGKIVAPDLYIAAGVSGSTQHMAGIKDSKVIVAINKDPDAPIFEFADFGLVADLFDAVPELTSLV